MRTSLFHRLAVIAAVPLALAGCGSDEPQRVALPPSERQEQAGESPEEPQRPPLEAGECTSEGGITALVECLEGGDEADGVRSVPVEPRFNVPRAPQSNVDPSNPYPYTVEEYLTFAILDMDRVWTDWFLKNGFSEPLFGYQLVGPSNPSFVSSCTNVGQVLPDTPNAYYCPADAITTADGRVYQGMVILPVLTMQQMWTGTILGASSRMGGDFGAAIVTAHEMGHHVQDELTQQVAAQGTAPRPLTGSNAELIADCFAGVWMTTAYRGGLLSGDDVDEAVAALEAIGAPVEGAAHGTPAQRREALLVGYNGLPGVTEPGDPMACIQTYWY